MSRTLSARAAGVALLAALAPLALPAPAAPDGLVALRAGSAHVVADGTVIEGGVVLLMRGDRIVAVGGDVDVPPGATVIDYGPDATLVPGLVAANAPAIGPAADRTASPGLRAADGFDFYSDANLYSAAGGVTCGYVPPAEDRLLAGVGAVVKTAGPKSPERVISDVALLHGSIGADARRAPGFWEPPVPATADVGLGYARPQLPRSAMGAVVALNELLAAARAPEGPQREAAEEEYGADAPRELARLLDARTPWRIRADTHAEIAALLEFAETADVPLVLAGGRDAGDLAERIAAAGLPVVLEVDFRPNRGVRDLGKRREDVWPDYEGAAELAAAGVKLAIATPRNAAPRDLRFAAALASRGGLAPEDALRAITLTPAEILGVADRVGSLETGKDADVVVLNGPPLASTSTVVATWVGGELAWESPESTTVVIEARELHVGDGRVLRPGQVLLHGGRIVEVAERVAHPLGARVVRGDVAMPGMIDALGHLGLAGSDKGVGADYDLRRLVETGDDTDRRVARAGVTTVCLTPRGKDGSGVPVLAYKPAGEDLESMVVGGPVALRLVWTDEDRAESGKDVRELLQKLAEYEQKWKEYERELAAWSPPPVKHEPPKKADEADEDESDEASKEGGEEAEDDKKSKKKKKDEEEEGDVLTGVWSGTVTVPPSEEAGRLRLRLELVGGGEEGDVEGSLRCDALCPELIELEGRFEDRQLAARGLSCRGWLDLTGTVSKGQLKGTVSAGSTQVALDVERTQQVLEYAARPERRKVAEEKVDEPKGKPKEPKTDAKLEVLRDALRGRVAVIVQVEREDEILACVDAFEEAGLRPILYGASDAWRVLDRLQGRVAGVLLSDRMLDADADEGLDGLRNRYAELSQSGVPIAFHSGAEEGAAELPLVAAYAVSNGMSPTGALRALTAGAAEMLRIDERVGRLAEGLDGDVLLLDGPPLEPATRVLRAWVAGREVR